MNVLHHIPILLASGLIMLFEFYVAWEVLQWMEREEIKKWTDQ
jgi:hypothetical protein